MLPAAEALVAEIDVEAPVTRRVLERLPADRYDWRPHPKSLSASELARHIATIPGNTARLLQQDSFDIASRPVVYPPAEGPAALLSALDESVAAARDMLAGLDAERANAQWRLMFRDREVLCVPRLAAMRRIGLNHWYHHRGELVVYLRLLDVPVPIVYGRTADENPFIQ